MILGPRLGKYSEEGRVLAIPGHNMSLATIGWLLLKATIGIRVSANEERDGLDHGEHGNEAYSGFVMVTGSNR